MSNSITFTQARIKELPLPEKGRVDYYDIKVPKLTCRVSSSGNKSFVVTKWNGKVTSRVTLGRFPDMTVTDAQHKAQVILTAINSGIDPTAEKRKKALSQTSLHDVLELYLADRDLKPSTIKDYRYKLKLGFDDWLKLPVAKITEKMVMSRHKKISARGKTTANTTMRVLRLTLKYAVAIGMIEDDPTSILKKARLWHKNKRKDRVIHSKELRDWHEAVEALPNEGAKVYLLMALYMGFRSNELLTLEWTNVELKAETITMIDTKNRTTHLLPIPKVLLKLIKTLKESTGKEKFVFAGDKPGKAMAIPSKPINAVVKASGVKFSPHDCRRTFATIAEAVNLPMSMIKRLMNHVTTNDVTGGYIITEDEKLAEAINRIADYIQAYVRPQSNVLSLAGGVASSIARSKTK